MIVMRHAKSSWKNPHLSDHDRPLNKRGVSDSAKMAVKLFNETQWRPTFIYSSTAKRAHQTRDLWLQSWIKQGGAVPLKSLHSDLYFGGEGAFFSLIKRCNPTDLPMFIGHNPDVEDLLMSLTGEDLRITTANIVALEHSAQCFEQAVRGGAWRLATLLRPRPPRG